MTKRHLISGSMMCAALAAGMSFGLTPVKGQGGGSGKGFGKNGGAPVKAGPVKRFPDGTPDIQGFWSTRNFATAYNVESQEKGTFDVPAVKGVVVDPPDGKIPYQPWALAKKKELEHTLGYDPQAHCDLSGVPRQIYTPFGLQIIQPPGSVVILFEAFHAYRILNLTGHHPDPSIKLFEGDSRAHWEKDTLVVDVTNQNDRTWFDMAGNFHSDEIHVVERYTPTDENNINYEATITDPKTYTRPWTIAFVIGRNTQPGYENLEFGCVEGERDLVHYVENQDQKK